MEPEGPEVALSLLPLTPNHQLRHLLAAAPRVGRSSPAVGAAPSPAPPSDPTTKSHSKPPPTSSPSTTTTTTTPTARDSRESPHDQKHFIPHTHQYVTGAQLSPSPRTISAQPVIPTPGHRRPLKASSDTATRANEASRSAAALRSPARSSSSSSSSQSRVALNPRRSQLSSDQQVGASVFYLSSQQQRDGTVRGEGDGSGRAGGVGGRDQGDLALGGHASERSYGREQGMSDGDWIQMIEQLKLGAFGTVSARVVLMCARLVFLVAGVCGWRE